MPTNATRFYDSSHLINQIFYTKTEKEESLSCHEVRPINNVEPNKITTMTTTMTDDHDVPDNEPVAPMRKPTLLIAQCQPTDYYE